MSTLVDTLDSDKFPTESLEYIRLKNDIFSVQAETTSQ